MIELNKNIRHRSEGADKIVIPTSLLQNIYENSIHNIAPIRQLIDQNLYPFTKCIIISQNVNTLYFECLDQTHILFVIHNLKETSPSKWLASIINTDMISFYDAGYDMEGLEFKAFADDKVIYNSNELGNEQAFLIKEAIGFHFLSSLAIFNHINSISLNEPELETKVVKSNKKKGKKRGGNKIKYISTRKYILTGTEKKSRRKTPRVYTLENWSVRGHWRMYKDGKKVWIKPQERKRKKDKLHGKRIEERVYKVT